MPLTFAETPLYYKDSQGNYHRVLSGADMTGYRTASAQDAIDAAQDADIASRATADEIGIVITGARPAVAVTAGQYVIVRSSTITGIVDGLYTAINALSPSTDVSAADLTAVSGGGLNDLWSKKSAEPVSLDITGTTTSSGALPVPDAVKNGTFISAMGTTNAYFVFRRDARYFMVKDSLNLAAVANTSVAIRIFYIP